MFVFSFTSLCVSASKGAHLERSQELGAQLFDVWTVWSALGLSLVWLVFFLPWLLPRGSSGSVQGLGRHGQPQKDLPRRLPRLPPPPARHSLGLAQKHPRAGPCSLRVSQAHFTCYNVKYGLLGFHSLRCQVRSVWQTLACQNSSWKDYIHLNFYTVRVTSAHTWISLSFGDSIKQLVSVHFYLSPGTFSCSFLFSINLMEKHRWLEPHSAISHPASARSCTLPSVRFVGICMKLRENTAKMTGTARGWIFAPIMRKENNESRLSCKRMFLEIQAEQKKL